MGRLPFAAPLLALALACLGAGCTPSGPKALLQGAELIRKGNYEEAIAKLQIAKDLLPGDARAWNYLGLAYHGAGQFGEAIIAYQRAQELDKNLAEARYNLGELFLEQGNPVSAAEELTVFTALQPKSVEGWVRLGDAHFQNQRSDRAQTSYYTALNLKRETPEAFNGLGLILLQRKNPRDAYRYFVEANKYNPDYAPAILNMAVVAQAHLNSPPTALAKYREYLAKAPDAPNAAEVQAAIRQLDAQLNPHPETPKTTTEPPAQMATAPVSSNSTAVATAHTEGTSSRPTNSVPAAKTNATQVAAAKTNATAVPVVASAKTNVTRETEVARSAPPTNKPPVQVASVERTRTAATADKPATSVPAPSSDQPPQLAESAKPATTPEPVAVTPVAKPVEEPPLEVVQIEEVVIQPAGELVPASEIQSTPAVQAPVSAPRQEPAPASSEPLRRLDQEEATTEKRGFFQRINPVNLFRSEKPRTPAKPPQEMATSLPPATGDSSAAPSSSTAPVAEPITVASASRTDVTTIPGLPSAPRYQYGRIKQPVAGDRAAAERLFERGVGAQTRRDPSSAASFFSAATAADATYFPAFYNLGLVGYASGQWFSALSAFETALVLDPNSAEARYNFALTLQKARFPIDSARELERLLAQKPNDTRAMLLLGNVYAQDLENEDGARRMYQQLLAQEPQHPQATAIRYWLSEHP